MGFPIEKTNAIDGVTQILASHLNNLENKVGIDGDTNPTSLDYLVRNLIAYITAHPSQLTYVPEYRAYLVG